jgi:hypothetical protein
MAKQQRRPVATKRSPEPEIGRVFTDGHVHRLYESMDDDDRRDVVFAIGLKTAQRIGHRHKAVDLRNLLDLNSEWGVVDRWILERDPARSVRALGDLLGPLLDELVGRAVELLGDDADDPTADQLKAMGEEMAFERSWPQVRLLMAAVVELMFQADEQAKALSAADERFRIPD